MPEYHIFQCLIFKNLEARITLKFRNFHEEKGEERRGIWRRGASIRPFLLPSPSFFFFFLIDHGEHTAPLSVCRNSILVDRRVERGGSAGAIVWRELMINAWHVTSVYTRSLPRSFNRGRSRYFWGLM